MTARTCGSTPVFFLAVVSVLVDCAVAPHPQFTLIQEATSALRDKAQVSLLQDRHHLLSHASPNSQPGLDSTSLRNHSPQHSSTPQEPAVTEQAEQAEGINRTLTILVLVLMSMVGLFFVACFLYANRSIIRVYFQKPVCVSEPRIWALMDRGNSNSLPPPTCPAGDLPDPLKGISFTELQITPRVGETLFQPKIPVDSPRAYDPAEGAMSSRQMMRMIRGHRGSASSAFSSCPSPAPRPPSSNPRASISTAGRTNARTSLEGDDAIPASLLAAYCGAAPHGTDPPIVSASFAAAALPGTDLASEAPPGAQRKVAEDEGAGVGAAAAKGEEAQAEGLRGSAGSDKGRGKMGMLHNMSRSFQRSRDERRSEQQWLEDRMFHVEPRPA